MPGPHRNRRERQSSHHGRRATATTRPPPPPRSLNPVACWPQHRSALNKLQGQLEEAMGNKDDKRAAVLRQQKLVVEDIVAGVRTDMSAEKVDEILRSIPDYPFPGHSTFMPRPSSPVSSVRPQPGGLPAPASASIGKSG